MIDTIPYQDKETGKYVETKAVNMKVGQSLELFQREWETEEDMLLNKVEIAALTDQFPMGLFQQD